MPSKEDLTAQEEDSWRSLSASIAAFPVDRREEASLPNGWSVKDVEWHVAFWWQDCIGSLEALVRGDYTEYEGDTDEINEEALQQGRSMTLDEVEDRLAKTRDRLLKAWSAAPNDLRATETFSGETLEHYEEHADELAAVAGRLTDGST